MQTIFWLEQKCLKITMKILTKSVGILFIFSSPTRVTQVKYIEELPDMSDLVHAQPVAEYDDGRTVFPMQGER